MKLQSFGVLLFGLGTFGAGLLATPSAFAQALEPLPAVASEAPPAAAAPPEASAPPAIAPAPPVVEYTPRDPSVMRAPLRRGFTLELGLGAALTFTGGGGSAGYDTGKLGVAPISLSLGAFINRHVALMGRMGGTAFFQDIGGTTYQVTSNFYGAAVQVYLIDQFFVGGGFGFGRLTVDSIAKIFPKNGEGGVALNARAGFAFAATKHHAFALTFDVYPAFYGNSPTVRSGAITTSPQGLSIVGTALGLEWQYY